MEERKFRTKPPLPVELGMGRKLKTRRRAKRQQENDNFGENFIDQNFYISKDLEEKEQNFSPKSPKQQNDARRVKMPEEPKEKPEKKPPRAKKISQKTYFEEHIEKFIERELQFACSDSDRIYVFQRAFDFLLGEFQQRRALLSRIKQEYDEIARNLLTEKRKMETQMLTEFDAEENYNEVLTKMRKAKKIEFREKKEEADKYMDKLLELRVDKSNLTKELDKLERKNHDMEQIYKIQHEKTSDVAIKYQLLLDDITNTTKDIQDQIKEISQLNCTLDETTGSAADMRKKYTLLLAELDMKQNEKEEIVNRAIEQEQIVAQLEAELEEVGKDIVKLDMDKAQALEQAKRTKERNVQTDSKMRQLLKDSGFDFPNLSVKEIIQMLVNNKKRK